MSCMSWYYDQRFNGSTFLGFWEDGYLKVPITSILFFCTALLLYRVASLLQVSGPAATTREKKLALLRRQMTPIGRFALLSQTERNPSIISFFVALANKKGAKPIGIEEFEKLWRTRVMSKHERFKCHVSEADNRFFEVTDKLFDEYAEELTHPQNEKEFKTRISNFLTSPIDVNDKLWEATISTGDIGASGAIIQDTESEHLDQEYDSETVALFRSHHVLGDGVSLSTVIADVSDEADILNHMILDAIKKHKMQSEKDALFLRIISLVIGFIVYYIFGTVKAVSIQLWNMMTSSNPFDEFTKIPADQGATRSVSWKHLAPLDEAKSVMKSISNRSTLNDLFVTVLGSAIQKQYEELKSNDKDSKPTKCPSTVNIVIPVHLAGGVILPGHSIGNKIGAFVASIPFKPFSNQKTPSNSIPRLLQISKILHSAKNIPSPQISWLTTALINKFTSGESFAKQSMVCANCHSVAVLSNVKGFPFQVHWAGRPVETICPILPLPPGIGIGVVVSTYNGKIFVTIDADSRIVPDADRFLGFMLEEYEVLKNETIGRDTQSSEMHLQN